METQVEQVGWYEAIADLIASFIGSGINGNHLPVF